jgi:hypothetical protein
MAVNNISQSTLKTRSGADVLVIVHVSGYTTITTGSTGTTGTGTPFRE